MYFCQKVKKSENFSSTSTGKEKLIDISNKLQDELLKGITDLSVIQYHSNGCYKPYTLQARRELENIKNGKNIEQKIMKPKVQCYQNSVRQKRQKLNDNRSNKSIICGNKTFRKDSKLYRLCETERAELFLRATKFNMDAVFTKVSIFDKADYLFAADIMSHKQCINRLIFLMLSVNFLPLKGILTRQRCLKEQ